MSQDCIFCEPGEPCVTHAAKKKPPKKAKPAGSVTTAPIPPSIPSTSSGSEPDWFGKEPATESRFTSRATEATTLTDDELIMREALRNCESIMSHASRREYQDIMHPPLSAGLVRQRSEIRRNLDAVVEGHGPSSTGS